jgi:signal transduction histidine kinase
MARILVVDDEPVVVRSLVAFLGSLGHEVVGAGSGEEGLELLARDAVDLVLLDVLLPGLSGLDTCRRLRATHGNGLPVVMISARFDRESVQAGYDAGADDFLAKPLDFLSVGLKVRVLLRLKRLHDELLGSRRELERLLGAERERSEALAELYRTLEAVNARLVELDRERGELVQILAHDFRAPLAGVLGHAELLEGRPDAPREERVARACAVVRAARHMAGMVDKTLQSARLEDGRMPFAFRLVDVGAVARDAAARLAASPLHALALDVPEDPLPCWADRERLGEVLDNLLANAVKYSPAGGSVTLAVGRDPREITVRVSDQGIGIAPEHVARLFRPFSRVHAPAAADIQGTGLGLYICDRIARAHGGRLSLESRPGSGSSFTLALPAYGLEQQGRPPAVVLAAADQPTRDETLRTAAELGLEVHTVTDGLEAVEAAFRLEPIALVLDRTLPRLGAVEVARRLHDAFPGRGWALVALAEARELGDSATLFTACLRKPLERGALAAPLVAAGIRCGT